MEQTFKAVLRSWHKHFITQMTAVIIMSLTFAASLFILFAADGIRDLFYDMGKVNRATIYIRNGSDSKAVAKIKEVVSAKEFVTSIAIVTAESAATRFSERFANYLPQGAADGKISAFFPITMEVQLAHPLYTQEQTRAMELFAAALRQRFAEVEEVSFGRSWLAKYLGLLTIFGGLSWTLGFIIFLASLFVASSALKTVLYSRRDEIEILELCGATKWWIYGPQLLNCLIITSVAFGLALIINLIAYNFLAAQFALYFPAAASSDNLAWPIVGWGLLTINGAVLLTAYLTISGLTLQRRLVQ